MKRSPMPRGKGFTNRGTGFRNPSPSNRRDTEGEPVRGRLRAGKGLKAGKKTREWASERRKLKVESERTGLTTCELRGIVPHECTYDNFLGYAHNAKRRKLSKADLRVAILICNTVHDIIEHWAAEEMKRIVNDTIANRRKAA